MEEKRNQSTEEELHVDHNNDHEAFDENEDLNIEPQAEEHSIEHNDSDNRQRKIIFDVFHQTFSLKIFLFIKLLVLSLAMKAKRNGAKRKRSQDYFDSHFNHLNASHWDELVNCSLRRSLTQMLCDVRRKYKLELGNKAPDNSSQCDNDTIQRSLTGSDCS